MNYIKGNYRSSIFESESGYKVGLFKVKETNDEELKDYLNKTITFTGYFPDLNTEDNYILYGEMINHERYGIQYVVKSYEKEKPTGKDAIVLFLSSSLIKGCGEKTAEAIVNVLGEDAISLIKENYQNLLAVPHITEKKAMGIYNSLMKYSESDEIIIKLKEDGFSIKEATNIINIYGNKSLEVVKENIYLLKEIVYFNKLDSIFLKFNEPNDMVRIKACIIEVMNNLLFQNGDTYHYYEEIIQGLRKQYNLNITKEEYDNALKYLYEDGEIVVEENKYYLTEYYEKEIYIANSLNQINDEDYKKLVGLDNKIKSIESLLNIKYSKDQKDAIKGALNNNLTILTGGPGTGKTTVVKGIVKLFIEINNYNSFEILSNVCLLAPTGRASKKLAEVTELPAMTIHRYLKWNKEGNYFQVNENNKLYPRIIIVDEISMIDTFVMDALLKGVDHHTKLILIGDENQLPSVGGGLILNDLINSKIFKHISLTKIYRQASESYIPYLSKDIKDKNITESLFEKKLDYNFIETPNQRIRSMIKQICEKGLSHGYDEKEMIVLAPMYKGENGIDNLNIILQEIFNPHDNKKKELEIADMVFRENDKVIELVNDPDNNVFNGDIGYIDEINIHSKTPITVSFDGTSVCYTKEDLGKIKHAYAISIHKSQGSEFNQVIIPMTSSYNKMLYNKLIYTGVSRAKKGLVIMGERNAFERAINNNYSLERKTTLKERLNYK